MKRRILLVDDDLAVLLTLKAVLELHDFEVEIAGSTAEALARMNSGTYHMVISDLKMETEEAGLEVIRAAHRQSYAPATALLTAFPPSEDTSINGSGSAATTTLTPCSSSRSALAIWFARSKRYSSAMPTRKNFGSVWRMSRQQCLSVRRAKCPRDTFQSFQEIFRRLPRAAVAENTRGTGPAVPGWGGTEPWSLSRTASN